MTTKSTDGKAPQHVVTDVAELRRRARENIESGNVTFTYGGDARLVAPEGVPMLTAS